MNITVFGANGHVGQLVVTELLKRGHYVTAFVHGTVAFGKSERLRMQQGDVRKTSDVAAALQGADVVISALGSWGTPTKDILSTGMTVIVPAMEQIGVRRIVSLTGSAALAPGDQWGLAGTAARALLLLLAPKILRDGEAHIRTLAASKLEWTVVRSPVMNNRGAATYRLTAKLPGVFETINRRAVAQALVDQVDNDQFVHTAPHIHRA